MSLVPGPDGRPRCSWAMSAPDFVSYHDEEWGRPVTDDRGIYERLTLEAFQSGLSWLTILRKREAFRDAFAGFDYELVAEFDERDRERLLADAAIVRNRALACRAGLAVSHRPRRRSRQHRGVAGDHPRVQGVGQGAQAARVSLRR